MLRLAALQLQYYDYLTTGHQYLHTKATEKQRGSALDGFRAEIRCYGKGFGCEEPQALARQARRLLWH
jgi:hypothetical protein